MRQASGRDPVVIKVPIYGAGADIQQGALIMPGVTADTNIGMGILATGAAADAVGALVALHDYSVVGDSLVAGTNWVYGEVELFDQYSPVWVEYDQADTLAVASTSSTTVTITSLTADIDTSWLYAVSGTGIGKLAYLVSTASGSGVSKTATGWDSTTTCIKILRVFHQLAKLNSTATKIGTDAADGSWTVCILENWFQADGIPLQLLDPTKHDNLTLSNPRFFAKLLVRNTAGHTTE